MTRMHSSLGTYLKSLVLLVLLGESLGKSVLGDPETIAKLKPLAVVFLILIVLAALTMIILFVIFYRYHDDDNLRNDDLEEKPGISRKSAKSYSYDNHAYGNDGYYVDVKQGKKVPPPSGVELQHKNVKKWKADEEYDNPVYEMAE